MTSTSLSVAAVAAANKPVAILAILVIIASTILGVAAAATADKSAAIPARPPVFYLKKLFYKIRYMYIYVYCDQEFSLLTQLLLSRI
jgi:hypothetical protein